MKNKKKPIKLYCPKPQNKKTLKPHFFIVQVTMIFCINDSYQINICIPFKLFTTHDQYYNKLYQGRT